MDSEEPLEPWVIETTRAYISKNNRCRFAGYPKAYILSFIGLFFKEYGVYPTSGDIRQVFGYSQCNKPLRAMRELEDEGYIRLDERRCKILEVLKTPYYVPRPAFALEKINDYRRALAAQDASERGQRLDLSGSAGT